jgi:hypothetical protein
MSLADATRSEVTKQFSTSIWWILAIVLAVYVAFTAAVLAFVFSASATGALTGASGPALPADVIPPMVYSIATAVGYVFPLLIGTLMVTTEYRHKTLTPTFLATPKRGLVLGAKVIAGIGIGVLFAVIGIVSAVAPAAGILAGLGVDTAFSSSDTWALLGRMVLAYVLWVFIGVGVGVLVRNQVAAIVGVLVFTQFLEPIGRAAAAFVEGLSDVTRFLPGAASDALVGASVFTMGMPDADSSGLEWWVGGLVLFGYGLVFLLIGHFTSWRRDLS